MVAQLKILHLDKGKDKASERTQQALDKLEYFVTFNRSITQAMARTMQDLPEDIANLTLARCDSYLEYLRTGVKQETLTALHTAPVLLQSLFPDQLLVNAEEEVSRSEQRRSSGNSHSKLSRYHPCASSTTKASHQPDQKSGVPAWKQIKDRQQGKKGRGKASTFQQKLAKGSKQYK